MEKGWTRLLREKDERIAALTLDRDVTIQFREEAEKRVKQLTADLSKPPQERIHCKGCSLPDEKQGLKQQIAALRDTVATLEYLINNDAGHKRGCAADRREGRVFHGTGAAIGEEEGK